MKWLRKFQYWAKKLAYKLKNIYMELFSWHYTTEYLSRFTRSHFTLQPKFVINNLMHGMLMLLTGRMGPFLEKGEVR